MKIRLVELLATIKVNLVAFLSISMFVCLGVGLFLGIQWGDVAFCSQAEKTMEERSLHDFEIDFPYGITNENIDELRKIDGVD